MTRAEHQKITKLLDELIKAPKDINQFNDLLEVKKEIDYIWMQSEANNAAWERELAARAAAMK